MDQLFKTFARNLNHKGSFI